MRPPSPRWFALCLLAAGAATLAVGLGGRFALVRRGPPWREGASLLRVDLPRSPLDDAAAPESERRPRLDAHRRTVAVLILSPNVLSAATSHLRSNHPALLDGKADPVEWLGGAVRVDEVGERILAVSTPGESRGDQAVIVNAVVDEFLAANELWEGGARKTQLRQADASLAQYRQDLAVKRRALREGDDPERQAALRDEVAVLEDVARRLAMARERLRLEDAGWDSIKQINKSSP